MKKVLSLTLGVLVIFAFAIACADITPVAPDETLEPSMATVGKLGTYGKYLYAYGNQESDDGFFSQYYAEVRDYKYVLGDDTTTLRVQVERAYPYESCTDFVELGNKEYSWSMAGGWVKAETACGPVEVTWDRTSKVTQTGWNFWTGATENCSPPEGEFSMHLVGNGRQADADAIGMVGWVSIPVTGTSFEYNYAYIHHGTSQLTACGSS